MRTKYAIFSICVTLIIMIGVLLRPSMNGKHPFVNYLHHLVWGDIITLEVEENLDKSQVKVAFINEMGLIYERHRHNPDALTQLDRQYKLSKNPVLNQLIIEDGKQINELPYSYGKQVLRVYYKDIELGDLYHWKTNHWHSHRYKIIISQEHERVILEGNVSGPDNMLKGLEIKK